MSLPSFHASCHARSGACRGRRDVLDEICAPIDRADEPFRRVFSGVHGRFTGDDVVGTLASIHQIGRSGPERPGDDCWIVRLGPACGHPVGIVHATWKWDNIHTISSVEAVPSLLSALRATRHFVGEHRDDTMLNSLLGVDVDAREAVGRLFAAGVIVPGETRDHADPDREFPHVTSLIARLDDAYDGPDRRFPEVDGEPFDLRSARILWRLHVIDPVHGVHAWGVARRREAPRRPVVEEMSALGYDVAQLARGADPLVALGLRESSGVGP